MTSRDRGAPAAHFSVRRFSARAHRAPALGQVAALVGLVGCSSVKLVPLEPTRGNEALVVGSGIAVSADSDRRLPTVPSSFTPVRLTVHNTGAMPVYVTLEDIELAGPEQALDAVPPARVPVRPRIASLGLDPMSPFVIQQITGGAGRVGRTESVLLEPRGTPPAWPSSSERSRQQIAESAFRGGPIAAGETREGFVYFPAVPAGTERVTLRVAVRSSPESAPAAIIEIPYAVRG